MSLLDALVTATDRIVGALSRLDHHLETIAESQKVMADAIKKEEQRSQERMDMMRRLTEGVEIAEAEMLISSDRVTKQ